MGTWDLGSELSGPCPEKRTHVRTFLRNYVRSYMLQHPTLTLARKLKTSCNRILSRGSTTTVYIEFASSHLKVN